MADVPINDSEPALPPQPTGSVAAGRQTGEAQVAHDASWTHDG